MANELWKAFPCGTLTTGIGSLPHPYVDAALQFSFRMRVPFLPQLPIRNPREFMLGQAIDGLPGLVAETDGSVTVDLAVWKSGTEALREATEAAFAAGSDEGAFEAFLPGVETWSAWTPFLFELQEKGIGAAKAQIAGPMTCQWSLMTTEGKAADRHPEVVMQVYRVILARAIAMVRALRAIGVTPILMVDEPAFYGFTRTNPRHATGLGELKLFLQTLRKERAIVGMHCCSNTDWNAVLSLPLDVLSFDVQLSLESLLTESEALGDFLDRGGRLSLGIVPTGVHAVKIRSCPPALLVERLMESLSRAFAERPDRTRHVLATSLVTPACGLALHTVEDAALILDHTLEVGSRIEALVKS